MEELKLTGKEEYIISKIGDPKFTVTYIQDRLDRKPHFSNKSNNEIEEMMVLGYYDAVHTLAESIFTKEQPGYVPLWTAINNFCGGMNQIEAIRKLNHPLYSADFISTWEDKEAISEEPPLDRLTNAGAVGYITAVHQFTCFITDNITEIYVTSIDNVIEYCYHTNMDTNANIYYKDFCITVDHGVNPKQFTLKQYDDQLVKYTLLGKYSLVRLIQLLKDTKSNLRRNFQSPHEYADKNGLDFTFLGEVGHEFYGFIPDESEIRFWVRLSNGEFIQAWPEEIILY